MERTGQSAADIAERKIYSAVASHDGIKARELASLLGMERKEINRLLYGSPLMHELCMQDEDARWHAFIRQAFPHDGLFEFSGWYSAAGEFLAVTEEEWLAELKRGCDRIGRSLTDTRGLTHSFLDCRKTMLRLFADLREFIGDSCLNWEIVFEFRLKKSRYLRIYADVLVITEKEVFSLEFKMKDEIDPDEVAQAAKYCPYLEIVFGDGYRVIPALVLTAASELFTFVQIGERDAQLPVCSGDMLFNVFDEYMGFLNK